MCGIIGVVKGRIPCPKNAAIIGLFNLHYRGYDSVGMAVRERRGRRALFHVFKRIKEGQEDSAFHKLFTRPLDEAVEVIKAVEGRHPKAQLIEELRNMPCGEAAIGHNRWATHGEVSLRNTHPHIIKKDGVELYIAHNGEIANYKQLKKELEEKGYTFNSDTDTEVLGALLHHYISPYQDERVIAEKMREALDRVEGTYAITVLLNTNPKLFYAVHHQPLLLFEAGGEEIGVASDRTAFAFTEGHYTTLEDGAVGWVGQGNMKKPLFPIPPVEVVGKEGYEHFMLKEIHEIPQVIKEAIRAPLPPKLVEIIGESPNVFVLGAGTSYNAGKLFTHYAHILNPEQSFKVMFAHNFFPSEHEEELIRGMVLAISQSGETGDLVKALHRLKEIGDIPVGAVLNRVESTIGRRVGEEMRAAIHAGEEIGVAATKSYINQVVVLLRIAEAISSSGKVDIIESLLTEELLVEAIEEALSHEEEIEEKALWLLNAWSGSGKITVSGIKPYHYTAEEIRLKLHEVGEVPVNHMPLGEIKHGYISTTDEKAIYIIFAPTQSPLRNEEDNAYAVEALRNGVSQIISRDGRVLLIGVEGEVPKDVVEEVDQAVMLGRRAGGEIPTLFAYAVVGQLLAYYFGKKQGKNPDRPRNLAKSVTVG